LNLALLVDFRERAIVAAFVRRRVKNFACWVAALSSAIVWMKRKAARVFSAALHDAVCIGPGPFEGGFGLVFPFPELFILKKLNKNVINLVRCCYSRRR
jgi:hypothetical protein